MIEIARACATSTASPAAFYSRWIDHGTWTQWDTDTDWVQLDGPVAEGTNGLLKPKGGPKTRFTIAVLDADREYTDSSRMPGATLRFQHLAVATGTHTELTSVVTLEGPLAWLWAKILGKGFAESASTAQNRLIELVESAS